MNKLKLVAVFVTIIALTALSGAAKKPDAKDKSATEYAVFGAVPDGTMDIEGDGVVGTNVYTYSPITLYLSEEVELWEEVAGTQSGFARCLKKNGPEGGRLDFFFGPGCTEELSTCLYRLVVRDGIYDRKTDTDLFDPGSVLLDQGGEFWREGEASFSIAFFDEPSE